MTDATVTPFLMFTGDAKAAMTLYVSLFEDGAVVSEQLWGAGEPGPEGQVKRAVFRVGGQVVMCSDSPAMHDFSFTPSTSLFVECASEDQIERLAAALGEGGQVFMPLGAYGFSRRFTWLADRFGVSWQLNLA